MTIDEVLSNVNSLSEYIAKRDVGELSDKLVNMAINMLFDKYPKIVDWEKQYQLIKTLQTKDK